MSTDLVSFACEASSRASWRLSASCVATWAGGFSHGRRTAHGGRSGGCRGQVEPAQRFG